MSVWQFSGDWLSQFVPGSVFSHSAQLLSGCGHVQQACDPGGGGGDGGGDGGDGGLGGEGGGIGGVITGMI